MKVKKNKNNKNIMGEKKIKKIFSPVCEKYEIHDDIVKKVKKNTPEIKDLLKLASFYKIMADPTRLEILYSLLIAKEMCVCDISYILQKSQSAISHQLRILRDANLVKYRKEGKVVYYSLDDKHIKTILDDGFSHISENK